MDLKHLCVALLKSSYRQRYKAFNSFIHRPNYSKSMVSSQFATGNCCVLLAVFIFVAKRDETIDVPGSHRWPFRKG